MLKFARLAFAQALLRKQAGVLSMAGGAAGSIAKGIGGLASRAGSAFVKNPLQASLTGLGMYMGAKGAVAEVKGGAQKARAYRAGFDPNVQAFQSSQVGQAAGLPPPGQP